MWRSPKGILVAIGGAVVVLLLLATTLRLFLNVDHYKPRFEAAASHALGMDVRIDGRIGIGFFPTIHMTLRDGRIMNASGDTLVSARKTHLWVALLPLLRGEIRMRRIELLQPRIVIERDLEGDVNVERMATVVAILGALDGASVSVARGTLVYIDHVSGTGFEALDCNVVARHIHLGAGADSSFWQRLALESELSCSEIRFREVSVKDLHARLVGKAGVFDLQPVTMGLFGGSLAASLRADLSGELPAYQLRLSLPSFRIEEFLKTLSPHRAAEGDMDFTANLSMRGATGKEVVRSAAGSISLRAARLTLVGNDLDHAIEKFDSNRRFGFADVGAVFLAGPLGLVVTRGYGYAGLFIGSGGTTHIAPLISEWKVEHGIAEAQDVAMATPRNRIAIRGGLDFVNERFSDMTVAVIDPGGCARARQIIRGTFAKPEIENPNWIATLAGPMTGVFRLVRHALPEEPCAVVYAGSVAPPR